VDNTTPGAPKRILVVEDDQFLRDLYEEILTSAGYSVEKAIDGEDGYNMMKKGGYDLVLLDIMLPKLDGISILRKFHNEGPADSPNKAVVILSNLGQESIIGEAVNLGARGYMIKSDMTPEQALEEVKRYLAEAA
jgi:DNA-binding response OmpR family regulator